VLTLLNFQLYRLDPAREKQADQVQVVQKMGEAVDRLNGLSLRLLALSRNGISESAEELDLAQIIQEDVEFIRLHETLRSCRLELLEPSTIVMPVRRGLFDQMMLNLLLNAAEAVRGEGTIQVQLYRAEELAVIEVHDSGNGVAETDTAALFNAFYTTKPSGHGLGLYTVKACAELHNGDVSVERSTLGGACFRVRLPLKPTAQE
jgi:signal transduction histidine kinase